MENNDLTSSAAVFDDTELEKELIDCVNFFNEMSETEKLRLYD